MLDRVQINEYRGLLSIDVPLKPLTILLGLNNSGKTSFLSAVNLLGSAPTDVDHSYRIIPSDIWRLQRESGPKITGHRSGRPKVDVTRKGDLWIRNGENDHIRPLTFFDFSKAPLMQSQGANEKEGIPKIDSAAGNLPAYLDALLRKDRNRFFQILDTLKQLIHGFSDLNIATPSIDQRRIDIEFENGLVMDGQYASYGVKLLIFFVCLANHPNPPNTVLLEEPETGVHPKRLKDIINLLINLTQGKFAYQKTQVQVIASTHSPDLLNCIDPEQHQVLVFQRSADGSCTAEPIDTERLKLFMDEFMLGEVWVNREEEGLLSKDR